MVQSWQRWAGGMLHVFVQEKRRSVAVKYRFILFASSDVLFNPSDATADSDRRAAFSSARRVQKDGGGVKARLSGCGVCCHVAVGADAGREAGVLVQTSVTSLINAAFIMPAAVPEDKTRLKQKDYHVFRTRSCEVPLVSVLRCAVASSLWTPCRPANGTAIHANASIELGLWETDGVSDHSVLRVLTDECFAEISLRVKALGDGCQLCSQLARECVSLRAISACAVSSVTNHEHIEFSPDWAKGKNVPQMNPHDFCSCAELKSLDHPRHMLQEPGA
ncbi:hypothetical protein AOLI_G00137080 [Acnodon oligacanthus]